MKKLAVILCAALAAQIPAFACSAFLLKGDSYQVVGFNENWSYLPGMVVVNKRGLVKHNLSWSDLVAARPSSPHLSWTAKYGSVTFNFFGIDLPCYGMNEAGLFVAELALDKTDTLADSSRPRMFWAQWIQFQLDNYDTVEAVVQHLSEAPRIDWWPHFEGSHFFVTDAQGRTAAIEFIDGRLAVSTAARMPQPILCNTRYQDDLTALGKYQGFGGDTLFNSNSIPWKSRFITIAHRLKEYRPETGTPSDFAWKLLDDVRAGICQVVADECSRRLEFRSRASGRIKSISLANCDFSANSPIRYIDIHINFKGNVAPRLADWTPQINRAYTLAGFPAGYDRDAFYQSEDYTHLQENLLNYAEQLEQQTKTASNSIQTAQENASGHAP
jgi:hypothetical protein